MIIIAVILAIVFFVVDAKYQADKIGSGIYPNHSKQAVIALLYCGLIALLTHSGWQVLTCLLVLLALRWIVFDVALNLFRKKAWNYVGIKDKNDAKMDNFLLRLPNPELMQFIPKILLLILTIIIYLIL